MCVLGITCRLDVTELLEKRVKSRFSHRSIFLFPGDTSSLEQSTSAFDDRMELFRDLLSLPDDENVNKVEQQYDDCTIEPQFGSMWNEYVKGLAMNVTIVKLVQRLYHYDVSERSFRNFLAVAVSMLSEKHQKLEVNDFVEASKIFTQDDKILILEGLSILEFCLVRYLAIARLSRDPRDENYINLDKITGNSDKTRDGNLRRRADKV